MADQVVGRSPVDLTVLKNDYTPIGRAEIPGGKGLTAYAARASARELGGLDVERLVGAFDRLATPAVFAAILPKQLLTTEKAGLEDNGPDTPSELLLPQETDSAHGT